MTTAATLRLVIATLVAASSGLATAAERRVELDPAATTISFSLGATLHTVHGEISLSSGHLSFDPETGAAMGEIVVDATTADTGNASRDEDMHAKVLQSGTHPRIVLRPTRVTGDLAPQGAGTLRLEGVMEILGLAHEVSLPIEITIDDGAFSATAAFPVPYVAWGLEDPSKLLLRVAKEVEVTVETRGTIGGTDPS